jgi:DNA-binding NarL/FixJ family response regulator
MITFLWREESMSGKEGVSFKVMLVEDDDGFRRSLAGLLMSRFPSIVLGEAADGAEAMEKVESFLPQLIFMDIKLPGQSGLEVTRRIKALYPDINVIMLTSYDFPEYREAARASGAYGFLSKGSSTAEEIQGLVKGLWEKCTPSSMQPAA